MPPAEGHGSAADDGVAADVRLGLDHDHRRAGLSRDDGGRQAHRAGADDHDVRLAVPPDRQAGGSRVAG
ncbi:MAG: hypothetical protein WDM92_00540 [Caulobacteraceae bacterium]